MRRLTWLPFAVALFAFVLPFATVSCEGSRVEPTGADLVLGTVPETAGPNGAHLAPIVLEAGGGLATTAFLAFAIALVAAALGRPAGWIVLAGAAGVVSLVVLKTRGSGAGDGLVEVDASAGAFIAAVAGGVGALALVPALARRRPASFLPSAALAAIVAGYVVPAYRTDVLDVSYADSLDVRQVWASIFWLLPVAAGGVVAGRRELPRDLSTVLLGVFGPCTAVIVAELWRIWADEHTRIGAGSILMLFGVLVSAERAWSARRGRAERRAGTRRAQAPAPAREPRTGVPSAPGAGESPPAGR